MANPLFRKWSRWLCRIERDQLHDLLINRHIFKQLQQCATPYRGSQTGAELSQWMVQNYVAFAATAIRRTIERPNKKWRSVSLRILLNDMAANDTVLTRDRFRRLYGRRIRDLFADRDFERICRKKDVKHLSATRIRRDILEIEKVCRPVERLVNKLVAHTEYDRRRIGIIKYRDLDRAIEILETTFRRYWLLVHGRDRTELVSLEEIDVRPDLRMIWPQK